MTLSQNKITVATNSVYGKYKTIINYVQLCISLYVT